MSTIVLTGGGSAGHIIPNIALLPLLKEHFANIHYIGGNGMEKTLIPLENIPFHSTATVKFDRSNIFNNVKIPFVLAKGISQAKELLKSLNPDVVFSKGGYVALPTCFAAKSLNIPVVVHESDYSLGMANRLVSHFAKKTLTSFIETENGIFVGNPVRDEILKGNKNIALEQFPVDLSKKTILIFGGSQGSSIINSTVYRGLSLFTKNYNIIHISGKKGDFTVQGKNYYQISYSSDINNLFALCDAVVCRAGSNALSEIACLGKRCIVIPLPKGASRGDQLDNATSYQKKGYVTILPQENLYAESLVHYIDQLWSHTPPNKLDVRQINKDIVAHILSVIKKSSEK